MPQETCFVQRQELRFFNPFSVISDIIKNGELAQRESIRFTCEGSSVRTRYSPLFFVYCLLRIMYIIRLLHLCLNCTFAVISSHYCWSEANRLTVSTFPSDHRQQICAISYKKDLCKQEDYYHQLQRSFHFFLSGKLIVPRSKSELSSPGWWAS